LYRTHKITDDFSQNKSDLDPIESGVEDEDDEDEGDIMCIDIGVSDY
jgi:hypothetical protein